MAPPLTSCVTSGKLLGFLNGKNSANKKDLIHKIVGKINGIVPGTKEPPTVPGIIATIHSLFIFPNTVPTSLKTVKYMEVLGI